MASAPSTQSQSTAPLPVSRLNEIAKDACDSAFQSVTSYDHTSAHSWNTHIINTILQNLITETSPPDGQPPYKYAVNSTILQHLLEPRAAGADDEESAVIKKGMHSASGAYWNCEKDGSWNFKYDQSDTKGFYVVISVIWVSIV